MAGKKARRKNQQQAGGSGRAKVDVAAIEEFTLPDAVVDMARKNSASAGDRETQGRAPAKKKKKKGGKGGSNALGEVTNKVDTEQSIETQQEQQQEPGTAAGEAAAAAAGETASVVAVAAEEEEGAMRSEDVGAAPSIGDDDIVRTEDVEPCVAEVEASADESEKKMSEAPAPTVQPEAPSTPVSPRTSERTTLIESTSADEKDEPKPSLLRKIFFCF